MKGFRARAPLALWKVILIVIASLIGLAGATALVLFLTGRLSDKVVDPEDMAFTQMVDGQGYADNIGGNNWYFLSGDSMLTISCTTEGVTETKVSLSLRNGFTRDGKITDGVITIPAEVELNVPFKVELRRSEGQILGSTNGFSYITAKSQNILLPTKSAFIAVDTPVSEIRLAVGNGEIAQTDAVHNVVVGSTFNIDVIFTPENSKYLFNDKQTHKKVYYQVLGSDGVNYISYTENDGEYTFYADEVSGNRVSVVNAYAFSNSYFEKKFFDENADATTDEIIAFMQRDENADMVVSQSINIKVLDIEVAEVSIEPSAEVAEIYLDKYFTLSTNSTELPNNMSLGVSIKDSSNKPAQVLLGRVGIKMPKGKVGFSILGGRVMKVTTTAEGVVIEEETFDENFDYSKAAEGVEYYILPRTTGLAYDNYYWSMSSNAVLDSFNLDINFFHKDESGLWQKFFEDGKEKSINVLAKEGNNSVSLLTENIDLVINYDDAGKPLPAELELSADKGSSPYKVVYFLYDNTREGASVDIKDVFDCKDGVIYSRDYKGQNINITGITPRENYTLYELSGNILRANKSYSGSVVVVAALVRTDVKGNIIPDAMDNSKYQIVCFSGAKVINTTSTLSISNMSPTFSFIDEEAVVEVGSKKYLPAINRTEDGKSKRDMISFTLKLSSEDIAKDVEKLMEAYGKSLNIVCCDANGNEYQDQYLTLTNFGEVVDKRTANMATFEGLITIEEDYFSAGKGSVDQGRTISFKLVYDDGKEVRSKFVGLDEPVTNGVADTFVVYYQQPKQLLAKYQERSDISILNPINVQISSGANGLKIDWGYTNITGANYSDTINNLNEQFLSFTLVDQFNKLIKPSDGVYSVQFNEVRKDSNFVLLFEDDASGIPVKIKDFASTNGKDVATDLKVYVVDKKNGNSRVLAVNSDNTMANYELQSDLISFVVSTEGLDHIMYDKTDVVGNTDDERFTQADKNSTEITVEKVVAAEDTIRLSDLFRIYTTGADSPNLDYQIVFDGTWLQGFQGGTNGAALKKMMQFNGEDSTNAKASITDYDGVAISTLYINAPFKDPTTLEFSIVSTNNLYRVTFKLRLSSDVEISRSFENYQANYADYLSVSPTGAVSIFAAESYNLDEYLQFNNNKYSWAEAFIGKGVDLSSNVNGVFYESQGIASLNVDAGSNQVKLDISSVRQYTTITITLYYGVRSEYAFNTTIALYVNPNIVIEEKVDNLEENPLLDLNNLASDNIENYYSIWKATSYKNGIKDPVVLSGDNTALIIKNLIYRNKDEKDGFITIKNSTDAGKFAFVAGKNVDILKAYSQEFSIFVTSDAALDAVKVKVDKDGGEKVVKYDSKNRISITFSVSFNEAGVDQLIQSIFPGSSVITYDGETRLLLLADKEYYSTATGFNVKGTTGSSIYSNATDRVSIRKPTYIDHANTVSVSTTIDDGQTKLEVNVLLGVTVSGIGNELVYYSNPKELFNVFGEVDFGKLVSSDYADLEKNDVYEELVAGKDYKILHDINTEYSLTKDETIVSGKTYYQKIEANYLVVEDPKVGEIGGYYEKNLPEQGFYYNASLTNLGGKKEISVEILTGTVGYIANLATYSEEGNVLHINSLAKGVEGYIVLKLTMRTTGANPTSYTWYYRIKVLPNFNIGSVNYPYNESTNANYGEYLDTNSDYYNASSLTYKIDLDEKLNITNSGRHSAYRFDDIVWTDKPAGVITENYRVKPGYSSAVNVSFDGSMIMISYKDAASVGAKETIVIEKYWCVSNVEVVGSAMEYTFKLNQARTYSTSLYRGEVKDINKVGADNQTNYQATITAGSEEQIFIPTVRPIDGSVTGEMEDFGYYLKGDVLDLLDALRFKKIWVAEGTEVSLKPLADSSAARAAAVPYVLDKNYNIATAQDDEWLYANVVTENDGETETTKIEICFASGEKHFYKLEENKFWFNSVIVNSGVGETMEIGVSLEDLIVEYLDTFTQEYFTTSDTTKVAGKTYYVLVEGNYEVATFEEGAGFDGETQYYEKYRIAYKAIVLNPKANVSKDSSFELGVYTSDGIVFKVDIKAKSCFEWTLSDLSVESGNVYSLKDFIPTLKSNDEDVEIVKVELKLNNGSDLYREYYHATSDKNRVEAKKYYVISEGEYKLAEFEEEAGFEKGVSYFEKVSLNLSNIIDLTGEAFADENGLLDLDQIKLEIAPLVRDVLLDFDVAITSAPKNDRGNTSLFTFNFELNVSKVFDESATRTVQDLTWRYGQITFDVIIKEGEENSLIMAKDLAEGLKPTNIGLISTTNTKYSFIEGDGYEWVDTSLLADKTPVIKITPDDVGEDTQGLLKTLKVVGKFKGREISRFDVGYRYVVAKNVKISTYYPTPDGNEENPSEIEYISAMDANGTEGQRVSKDFVDFFNSAATFAPKNTDGTSKNRIEVVSARKNNFGEYVPSDDNIKKTWNISVSEISNLELTYATGDLNGENVSTITNEKKEENNIILANSEDGKVNLRFTLLNTASNGTIVFDVIVNKVLMQYKVTVVNNPIVKVTTNTPNYNLNRETVFAEDLSMSEEQTLFTEGRLLNYAFRSSAIEGMSYYVRLVNNDNIVENKIVPITVANRGMAVNIDLGKSYKNYSYAGTFVTLEGAQSNDNSSKVQNDNDLFMQDRAPNITSRIIAKYYDDKEIKLDDNNYIMLGTNVDWSVEGGVNAPIFSANTSSPYGISSDYLMEEAGDLVTFATESGRQTLVKQNVGAAYVGYFSGVTNLLNNDNTETNDPYSGVILLSQNRDAVCVKLKGSTDNANIRTVEIEIGGSIWYANSSVVGNHFEGAFDDISGLGRAVKLSGTTWIDCLNDLISKSIYGYQRGSDIELKTSDYKKIKTFDIAVNVGGQLITTDARYNLYLEVEFGVTDNADSSTKYTVREIKAGEELSLFDEIDFGIYNTRTGNKYSNSGAAGTDSLKDSGGKVELKIYGFSDLPIVNTRNADALQRVTKEIHDNLVNPKDVDETKEVVYKTGLNPRAGVALNQSEGSIFSNYITVSNVQRDKDGNFIGKNLDFSIRARGANNDGNHVMMRITYTVSFGNNSDPIEIAHNLMFKVLPNSRVTFLTRNDSTATTSSASEIIDGQSYASNQESPFALQNNDRYVGVGDPEKLRANSFYVWDKNDITKSAIQAYLYGNTRLNNASEFDYTYAENLEDTEYNNLQGCEIENPKIEDGRSRTTFYIPELKLGTRKFYITAVDKFGFKIKFYFTLTASENPQIVEMSKTTLVEGTSVVVGAQYLPVSPEIVTFGEAEQEERRQLLGSIQYTRLGNNPNNGFANVISNIPSQVKSIILSAQTSGGFGTVTKTIENPGREIRIWNSSAEHNGAGDWEGGTKQVPDENSENQWTTIYLTQEGLYGATISIYGVFNTETEFGSFTNLIYKEANDNGADKIIEQVYYPASGTEIPSLQVSKDDTNLDNRTRVTLGGISSYGFRATDKETISSLNIDAAQNFKSRVNDIKVKEVNYYLGEMLIGRSERGVATSSDPVSLITNQNFKFFDGKTYEYKFVKTKDNKPSTGKAYYKLKQDSTSEYEIVAEPSAEDMAYEVNANGEITKHPKVQYYERTQAEVVQYELTKDTTVNTEETYYTKSGDGENATYTIVSDPTDAGLASYYVRKDLAPTPIDGISYANDAYDFVVPVIDSIHFGTSNILPNVRMEITLVEGENTCVLSRIVSISRLANAPEIDNSVHDSTEVCVADALNDTLEIVLDAGESVTFAISDKPFTEVPTAGVITRTNNKKFTVTEYVGISANIQNLSENFYSGTRNLEGSDNDFYITVLNQTATSEDGKVDFIYNEQHISPDETAALIEKYDISRDTEIVKGKNYYRKNANSYQLFTESNFYEKVTDSDNIASINCYIISEGGTYTLVDKAVAADRDKYYKLKSEPFYEKTQDKKLVSGKNYFTYDNVSGTYVLVSEPNASELSTYYQAVTYYEKVYEKTQDEKVVSGKEYYTLTNTGVYEKVDRPVRENLSRYYQLTTATNYTKTTVANYGDNITLHINDVSELNGSSKSERLYFLFKGQSDIAVLGGTITNTNMYYQMVKDVSVFPLYETATSEKVDSSGNIEFVVDNYIRSSKTVAGQSEYYYIIPRAVWGKELTLKDYPGFNSTTQTLAQEDGYKFTYEISQDIVGGAGGAFIDDNGTIFTDKNFDIQKDTITVNVYMKVSGQNDFFDVDTTRLKLCTFRMMLGPTSGTTAIELNSNYGQLFGNAIAIPNGYGLSALYKDNEQEFGGFASVTDEPYSGEKTIACKVGDTIDFASVLGNKHKTGNIMHNLKYHVVQDNEEIIYYNNMDSYSVKTSGTHNLTVLVGYRLTTLDAEENSVQLTIGKVNITILAYDLTSTTDSVKMIYASTYKKTTDKDIVEGKTYYEINEEGQYVVAENIALFKYTDDTEVVEGKNYYELTEDGRYVNALYKKTTDTDIVEGHTYYRQSGDKFVEVTSPVKEELSSYYTYKIPDKLSLCYEENLSNYYELENRSDFVLGTGDWYTLDKTGAISLITTKNGEGKSIYVAPGKTGIYTETFVTKDAAGNTKVYSYTFYVVDGTNRDEKEVVLNQSAPYSLSNLYGSGYRFYKVTGDFVPAESTDSPDTVIDEISVETTFTNGANSKVKVNYIVKNPDGVYSLLSVTYKFTSSSSPTSESIYVSKKTDGEATKLYDAIKTQVEESLKASLNKKDVEVTNIQIIGENGVLSEENGVIPQDGTQVMIGGKSYLITYIVDGKVDDERFLRYNPTFYVYEDSANVTIITSPENNYNLNFAKGEIINHLNIEGASKVTIASINQLTSEGVLRPVESLSLSTLDSEDIKVQYLVQVRYEKEEGGKVVSYEKYFLINLTFTTYSLKADAKNVTISTEANDHFMLSETKADVIENLDVPTGSSVCFYSLANTTLQTVREIDLSELISGDITRSFVVEVKYQKTETIDGVAEVVSYADYYMFNFTFTIKN